MNNTSNVIWMIEAKSNGQYIPVEADVSRDNARLLQRLLKARGMSAPSRIRRYTADSNSRG